MNWTRYKQSGGELQRPEHVRPDHERAGSADHAVRAEMRVLTEMAWAHPADAGLHAINQ